MLLSSEVQQMAVKPATPALPVMQPHAAQTPHAHGTARPHSLPSMPDPLSTRHQVPAAPISHLTDQFRSLSVLGEPGYATSGYSIPPAVYQSSQRQYSQPWFHSPSVPYQMGSGPGSDQGPACFNRCIQLMADSDPQRQGDGRQSGLNWGPSYDYGGPSLPSGFRPQPRVDMPAYDPTTQLQERVYRGPKPSIPQMSSPDPLEFARLRMALENLLPSDATELFKYQILIDHLKLEEALLIADSYCNSRHTYTDTMQALTRMYGQPHKLVRHHITEVMDGPNISTGNERNFRLFALHVRSLVSMPNRTSRCFLLWLTTSLTLLGAQQNSGGFGSRLCIFFSLLC